MTLLIDLTLVLPVPQEREDKQAPFLAGQQVRLEGIYGFGTYLIGSANVSEEGKFGLIFLKPVFTILIVR